MASLLDLLFGRGATPNQIPMGSPLTPPQQGMPMQAPPQAPPAPPQAGSLVQQMAQASPAAPSNQPPPAPVPQDNTPIMVTGQAPPTPPDADTWKPHKAGILGQIADYFLDTHFGKENQRRNMEGALEHLNSNPTEAVRRMAKFDPEGAEELYKSVIREQHQAAMERHSGDVYNNMAENQTMTVLRNMAMNANPNNLGSVRNAMQNYAQAKGIDPSLIDTIPGADGTIDDFKTFAQGGIPGGRQISVTERTRNDDLTHGDRLSGQAIQRDRNAILAGQGAERIGIAKTNSGIAQQNANTAAQRAAVYANANQGRAVMAPGPGGKPMPGVVDKTGNKLTIFTHDGKQLLYIRGSDKNHWRFAHQIIGTDEKAGGTSEPDVPDDQ